MDACPEQARKPQQEHCSINNRLSCPSRVERRCCFERLVQCETVALISASSLLCRVQFQQLTIVAVGEQVQVTVWPLANVANALFTITQQPGFSDWLLPVKRHNV